MLFLNPDTEIIGDALVTYGLISGCVCRTAGIVGCRLLNTDLSLQTSCVQAFPSILNQALDTEHLRQALPQTAPLGNTGPPDRWQAGWR